MKKFTILFILFFAATFGSMAQDYQEVVYLTDGSLIKGFIIEQIPNDYLKIRTSGGKVYLIEMYEVERITKERTRTQNNRGQNINQRDYNNNRNSQRNRSGYYRDDDYDDYDDYDLPRNSIHFGVKTGGVLSNIAVEDSKNKTGFQGGVFAEFKFNKFAIQPELLFSMQGTKSDYDEYDDYDVSAKMNLTYLNIPVMAKVYVADGLCFEMGPQLGVLLSAKGKAEVEGVEGIEGIEGIEGSVDVKKLMNDVDFSMNFGASYQIPRIPLGFYARYSFGLTDLVKDVDSDEDAGKNRVFQVGAFVKF
ncbi:MAG: PorT family protein [Tannerella sp.]|nr:PorT family protein [Tannerella sp.]